MTRWFKFWPLLAGAAIAFIWVQHNAALRREGVWQETVRALNDRNAQLEDAGGRIDTVYRDSIVYRTKVKRVTDSLLRTDTVFSRDRVTQIVEGERQSCDAVIRTCEQKQANLLARLANRDSVIAVKDKQRPGWLKRTVGCAAGVAATTKGAGLGAACGVKWP